MGPTAPEPHTPATWADIAHLPEGTRVEILDGEVVFAPSPTPSHQGIASRIDRVIGRSFDLDDAPGGWWILSDAMSSSRRSSSSPT